MNVLLEALFNLWGVATLHSMFASVPPHPPWLLPSLDGRRSALAFATCDASSLKRALRPFPHSRYHFPAGSLLAACCLQLASSHGGILVSSILSRAGFTMAVIINGKMESGTYSAYSGYAHLGAGLTVGIRLRIFETTTSDHILFISCARLKDALLNREQLHV